MMSKEAMKLALEALERYQVKRQDFDRFADEITALREALAEQPAQQEPVGSVHVDTLAMLPSIKPIDGGAKIYPVSKAKYDAAYRLIYTSPPAQRTWVWLTDKERNNLWREIIGWGDPSHDDEDLMKAIEDASRRKNT